MDIMGLQKQISSLGDDVLTQALSTGGEQVPHLMLMMEMARRKALRSEHPQGPVSRTTIRDELAMNAYNPVPTPPPKWPDLAAYKQPTAALPGQSMMQSPNNNSGIGALLSQNSLG
jgi:hypothetical protein